MLHIEFLGLPGSGKSSIYKLLERTPRMYGEKKVLFLASEAYKEENAIRKKASSIWFNKIRGNSYKKGMSFQEKRNQSINDFLALRTPLVVFMLKQLMVGNIPEEQRRLVIRYYFNLFFTYEFLRKNIQDDGNLLLDEGFIQRVVSVFAYGTGPVNRNEIYRYLSLIPRPDVVIKVDARPETCLARIKKRGYPKRLEGCSDQEVMNFFLKCQKCFVEIEHYLCKKQIHIIRADNEMSCNNAKVNATFNIIKSIFQLLE